MPLGPGGVPTHSIQVPPPHDANPADLRRAAVHLQQCADEVYRLVASLRGTVSDLTLGGQTSDVLGKVLTREALELGKGPVDTKNLRVVLRRSSASPLGFVVYTAFPVLKK
jgi:hypothetical protein